MSKIEQIHKSSSFGTVIEMGCGCPIANSLLSIEGAAGTVYKCEQPYSKETQKLEYDLEDKSVSIDAVERILQYEHQFQNPKYNFTLVLSFQMAVWNSEKITHGWIGFMRKEEGHLKTTFYHITIPIRFQRNQIINQISDIGIELLYSYSVNKNPILEFVDQVVESLERKNNFKETFRLFNVSESENYLCFSNNKFFRFEELFRKYKGLVLFKGSFNPFHEGHKEILDITSKEYPDYAPCCLVSTKRYDKPDLSEEELIEKIEKINSLGYYVVVCKDALFFNNMKYLNDNFIKRHPTHKIIFPVGIDTINRIIEAVDLKTESPRNLVVLDRYKNVMSENHYFYLYSRKNFSISAEYKKFKSFFNVLENKEYDDPNGISSTLIRQGKLKSNL